ncbi:MULTISPECIES: heme exporter protein CcmD [Xanthomonas]|uniref:Heme exporter protein D n=5 Tax=Xanthomonas TaxID=338 RepID=A0A6V7DF42_9XANT|nr:MULTISPECIES: heme exporter protein CcmD [Xanthomonas]KQQ75560.1 heme transporter CcmD [Xanthomonas sp. Leaf131]ETC87965.1 heme exporter protein D [Xanthomonas hortorum pv. carotae str. M081]MBG3850749.1 heme exporter protein CcmD [Xanthomonas hortorum pv. carotae]MCC8555796.1 heme exporter protein CcmD [Xanthomonas hortorum pv. gardneri]MCE4356002.1 heme exporter protein CcmD [Xanthomonas hortorum pv. pelargonii]
MSYLPYVIAAYAVFVLVLLWDLIAGRWQVRRALKIAQARRLRERKRAAVPTDAELIR